MQLNSEPFDGARRASLEKTNQSNYSIRFQRSESQHSQQPEERRFTFNLKKGPVASKYVTSSKRHEAHKYQLATNGASGEKMSQRGESLGNGLIIKAQDILRNKELSRHSNLEAQFNKENISGNQNPFASTQQLSRKTKPLNSPEKQMLQSPPAKILEPRFSSPQ